MKQTCMKVHMIIALTFSNSLGYHEFKVVLTIKIISLLHQNMKQINDYVFFFNSGGGNSRSTNGGFKYERLN